MKPDNHLFRLLIFVATIFLAFTAHAAEVITSFHSDIVIEDNGDLRVTEKITVIAEGNKIKRGIYRDFPVLIEDRRGRTKKVGFEILSVKRDGKTDDWHKESLSGFVRLYIGNANVFVSQGRHDYEITYRTDRQLRFFDSHDELLWNVTGTEWEFAINKASARVILPQSIKITDTVFFTGPYGSKDKNAIAEVASIGNIARFETTKPLGRRAGLTIGIKMPKGSFAAEPEGKSLSWFWRDYAGEIVGLVALFLVGTFYFVRWWQFGRDPEGGVIVPNWDTSRMMSPALTNYVDKKGFSASGWKAMTAAILNLAVKGYVIIEQLNDKPTITRTDKPIDDTLPIGEAKLVSYLDGRSSRSIRAIKSNGTSIKTMNAKFKDAINAEHKNAYYKHNWGSVIFGIILSVVAIIAILASGGVGVDVLEIIIPLAMVSVFLSVMGFNLINALRSRKSMFSKIFSVFMTGFMIFLIVTSGLIGSAYLFDDLSQPLVLACFAGILIINVMFFFLMGAPTPLGREKMDALEGMKTYLVLAEEDRMNMAGAPKMSPQHYETLLPYAVALGVEKPWSNSFRVWLSSAAAAAAGYAVGNYASHWYRGDFGSDSMTDSLEGLADNMASSFTASLPVPKSSSSGFSSSGGFSGGGGGGGGGGGW